jgi:hypothetical protein
MWANQHSLDRLLARSLTWWWAWGVLFLSITVCYLVRTPMNLDVAWLLYAARKVMDGAKLYVDIYEINLPLVVYFDFPAVGIARLVGWSEIPVFYGYVLILVGVSLWLSRNLIDLIFENSGPVGRTCIFLTLFFLLTVWPLGVFGQREHLVFILTIAYIWAAIARAQGQQVTRYRALLIGCLAGLGFSFKPYFVVVWLTVEGYLALFCRIPGNWRRPENSAIVTVMAFYLFFCCIWELDYLTLVPLIRKVYFAYDQSLMTLVLHPGTLIWALAGITLLLLPDPQAAATMRLLFLAATAFLVTAFLQKKGWPNHMYPAMATSLLLLAAATICRVEHMEEQGKLTWLSLPTFAWGLLVVLTVGGISRAEEVHARFQGGPLPRLIPLVKEYAYGEPIYVLTTNVKPSFPLVNYSGARWPYHFHSLWPLPGFYHQKLSSDKSISYHPPESMDPFEKFMVSTVVGDLVNTPPKLLIVDVQKFKIGLGLADFDFIGYFSQDGRFKDLLSHYKLLTQCDGFIIFKYENASK